MHALLFPALLLLVRTLFTTHPVTPPETGCSNPVRTISPGTILTSTDNGNTWRDISSGLPQDGNPGNIEAMDEVLYVSTQFGLYKGNASLNSPNWQVDPLAQNDIFQIQPGKNGPYAISYRKGIYHYHPVTGIWMHMSESIPDKDIHCLLESRSGAIYTGCASGVYRSVDQGKNWDNVLSNGHVFEILETDQALIVRTEYGLWRSPDSGKTWNRSLQTVNPPFFIGSVGHDLVAICYGETFLGIPGPNIIYRSANHGVTWSPAPEFVTAPLFSIHEIQQNGDSIFACSGGEIFRSDDAGITWKPILQSSEKTNGVFRMTFHHNTLFALFMVGC